MHLFKKKNYVAGRFLEAGNEKAYLCLCLSLAI